MRKIAVILICGIMLFSGCGKEKSQIDIPENMEVTKLSDVLKNPTDYHEKNVLLKGVVTYVCASRCKIKFQEGTNAVEIHAKGFKFPKLKTGRPVKIYAEVTAGKERVIISALKLDVVK